MNRAEAKEMTEFGMWTKISPSIKDFINDACNNGDFEINISSLYVTEMDKDRLIKLGYTVTYDKTDEFDPRYYISWE